MSFFISANMDRRWKRLRIKPTTVDWDRYLRFIADRRNTITRILYKNDPTIAMVELFGEIPTPHDGSDKGAAGTTYQITSFFRRTLAEWRALAPNILVSTGGFSHLNDPRSGLDSGRAIVRDPNDATCDVEVNSTGDLRVGVARLSSFCKRLRKPWFLAAWSACYGDPAMGYDYFSGDEAMAQHARSMYLLARGGTPAAEPWIGEDFWNLADTPAVSGTCNIGPSFPLTFAAVQAGGKPSATLFQWRSTDAFGASRWRQARLATPGFRRCLSCKRRGLLPRDRRRREVRGRELLRVVETEREAS